MDNECLGKDLNQLLPSDILNDIDIETEGNNQYEEEEEIVDDLAYRPKPGPKPVANKSVRFYSDSNVFLNSQPKLEQVNTTNANSQNYMMNYAMMNPMFSINHMMIPPNSQNLNPYMNPHIYNGMGLPFLNIQVERKRTDPAFFNSRSKDFLPNQMKNTSTTSNITHLSRKKTNSSSNVNVPNAKMSTKSVKESFDSGTVFYSRKLSEFNVEQYEIEDFNNYLESLHYDLQDYICTQKGSKELQKNLNKSPSECKTLLINTLKERVTKVMIDKCGNYFCQQLFQSCTTVQLILLLNYIKNDIVRIAKNYSGTHSLQALIDLITTREEETILLSSIKGEEIDMAYDNNATHVLQKLILCINEDKRENLNNAVLANIVPLCFDANGICVAKKVIKTTYLQSNKEALIRSITNDCLNIAQNAYGNYAIQYIFEEWNITDYPDMIKILINNIETLSIQKFSSNVSEKLIERLDDLRRSELFNKMFNSAAILRILKMRYGKYVLQKAIKFMSRNEKKEIRDSLAQSIANTNTCTKETNKLESFLAHFDS